MRILSDEEIRMAIRSINSDTVNKFMDGSAYDKVYPEDRAIAEAQAKKTLEVLRENTVACVVPPDGEIWKYPKNYPCSGYLVFIPEEN